MIRKILLGLLWLAVRGMVWRTEGLFGDGSATDIGAYEFNPGPLTFWVPREVVVTLQFAGQKYRNRHYYSDYQVFMIAVEEKIIPPVVKK